MVSLVRQNDILHLIDWYQTEYCEAETYFEEFRRDIESWTGVEAVEVVRCKDCGYLSKSNECLIDGVAHWRQKDDNDFCSLGERREDGAT